MMNRRDFVARLLAGASGVAIAATFDVDRLLWVPGAKSIFIPERIGFGNQFVTPDWVLREVSKIFTETYAFACRIDRAYDAEFVSPSPAFGVRILNA